MTRTFALVVFRRSAHIPSIESSDFDNLTLICSVRGLSVGLPIFFFSICRTAFPLAVYHGIWQGGGKSALLPLFICSILHDAFQLVRNLLDLLLDLLILERFLFQSFIDFLDIIKEETDEAFELRIRHAHSIHVVPLSALARLLAWFPLLYL